ncbi:MAG TPA: hypothetical protein VGQ83_20650, partial [Polyangia bacterium]
TGTNTTARRLTNALSRRSATFGGRLLWSLRSAAFGGRLRWPLRMRESSPSGEFGADALAGSIRCASGLLAGVPMSPPVAAAGPGTLRGGPEATGLDDGAPLVAATEPHPTGNTARSTARTLARDAAIEATLTEQHTTRTSKQRI